MNQSSVFVERRHFSLVLVLLLLGGALSGCITTNASSQSEGEMPIDSEELPPLEDCIEFEDMERCWQIYAPEGFSPTECLEISCPLVVDIHGYTDFGERQRAVSGFDDMADEFGFLVMYPIGSGSMGSWNSGWCCGDAKDMELNDVGLIENMVAIVQENWSTDPNRIYVTGWSNGCSMTQKLVNEASHLFAAAGCMAHYLLELEASDYTPVPMMEVHGVRDAVVHYGVTYANSLIFDRSLEGDEGALQNMERWAEMNGCSGSTPDVEIFEWDYSVLGYSDCENNAQVRLVSLNFAGHNPYKKDSPDQPTNTGNPTGIDTSRMVWEFMSQFSKNEMS